MYTKTSIYDTFNAKYLTFQEVSESFIPNDEYYQLLGNNHTLIMGPRGCGKTTLLKMLTSAGLNYWKTDYASEIKQKIPFTAIYIPSDIQWKNQLEFIEKHFEREKELGEKITDFLISTNIQLALCRTMQSFLQFELLLTPEKINIIEDEVSRDLINAWNIQKPISPSFDDIELSLQKRVIEINSLVNKLVFKKQRDFVLEQFPEYIFSDFFDLVKIACSVFERRVGLSNQHRWALCFDELEISPKFLQIKLLRFLRSVDQKFLFKLTTTPLFNIENNLIEASQDNDFKTIKLWVHDDSGSKKWREFCSSLVSKKLRRRFKNDDINPEDVFGQYNLDDIIKDELSYKKQFSQGTGEGSSVNALFKVMSEQDLGFRKFLQQRKIDFQNPYSRNHEDDKSIFLKHKVNVLYRYLFRNRTRKTPAIHYGVPYIYDICDGNPRSIIGLVDDILQNTEHEITIKDLIISERRQSEIIVDISRRYFNLIRNHPDSTLTIRNKDFNLASDLLRPIGNYIYSKIVKDEFNRSVHTTFTVDAEIDQKIIRLMEHALFIGAIIYLDPVESLSNRGLVGKRFRMSYLLTPLFRIPSRVNSQVNLKTIIADKEQKNDQVLLDF